MPAMIEAIGKGLGRKIDGRTPNAIVESLQDLSAAILQKAQSAEPESTGPIMAPDDILAAAENLENIARRMRELASAGRPQRADDAAPQHHLLPVETPKSNAIARILLADDLDLNRKLISDMLSIDGHIVDCVADGAAAVHAVEARQYDLVLMDMVMPVMDGLAATRAIRALPGTARDVPIVALTANAFREQLNSCIDAGMDAALAKPMTVDSLAAVVAQWTRRRHAAA